ncbi:hypothetical protein BC827DRAFT_1156609 [Russula dissimulans]|nr:hypothetical protein BC827DRAFT_1156609 [Russula dissimulans]
MPHTSIDDDSSHRLLAPVANEGYCKRTRNERKEKNGNKGEMTSMDGGRTARASTGNTTRPQQDLALPETTVHLSWDTNAEPEPGALLGVKGVKEGESAALELEQSIVESLKEGGRRRVAWLFMAADNGPCVPRHKLEWLRFSPPPSTPDRLHSFYPTPTESRGDGGTLTPREKRGALFGDGIKGESVKGDLGKTRERRRGITDGGVARPTPTSRKVLGQ